MTTVVLYTEDPYPGLRPFREDEFDIFFGREVQTDQLLARLASRRFLAVTGPSGCGKSSLVKAGMIPALKAGFMVDAGSHWRICDFRPGNSPMGRLTGALSDPAISGSDRDIGEAVAETGAALRRGPLGLIEVAKRAEGLKGRALLILVDQFEEIFRYRSLGFEETDEADAFVALLLAATEQREVQVYVVITMRSEYLGDCAVFHGLAQAVSDSQYLTPRLEREELEEAIQGPARVFGGRVDDKLVNRLINDFGTTSDQLPLVQHVLMRLWNREKAQGSTPLLTISDYEDPKIGGLSNPLSTHADEIFGELNPDQQRIAKIMFKRLSNAEKGRNDLRMPARVREVAEIASVEPSKVIAVAEAFRRRGRCFLAASEGPIDEDTLLDISHESLIRQWGKLDGWAKDEAKSVEMYRLLCYWSQRWNKSEANLWRGLDLASAVAWHDRENPNLEWAKRYGTHEQFELAMRFLESSEQAQREKETAETAKRARQLREAQRWAWGSGIATLLLLAGIAFYFVAYHREHDAYYNSYVKIFGVPHGIGKLNEEQVASRAMSFKITKRGRLGPVIRMQGVNAMGQAKSGGMQTSFASSATDIAKHEARWEYLYDDQDRVVYEVAFDRKGQQAIRYIMYSPFEPSPSDQNLKRRFAYMIGAGGSLAPAISGSCTALVKYEYSDDGYEARTHYLDQDGKPTAGMDGVFIAEKAFDAAGNVTRLISLWKDGHRMNDKFGNAEARTRFDNLSNPIFAESFDAAGAPIDVSEGGQRWQRTTLVYDDFGNLVEAAFLGADGNPGMGADKCHLVRYKYDKQGNMIEGSCLDQEGHPINSDGETYAFSKFKYNGEGRPTEWTFYDRDGHPAIGPDGAFRVVADYDAEDNMISIFYFSADGKPTSRGDGVHEQINTFEKGRKVRTEYRDAAGKPMLLDGGYAAIERKYTPSGYLREEVYQDAKGHPVLNKKLGFATRQSDFDICGREVRRRDLSADGTPLRVQDGLIAVTVKEYDDSNNVVKESYLDENGRPASSSNGAHVDRKFNRHRQMIEESYFEVDGKEAYLKDDLYAKVVNTYDDHNRLVDQEYFDAEGNPVSGK